MTDINISRQTYRAIGELSRCLVLDYPDTGEEKLTEMLKIVDPNLPGMFMMAALTGKFEGARLIFDKKHPTRPNQIQAIKAIRAAKYMGLVEAKNIVEEAKRLADSDNNTGAFIADDISDEEFDRLSYVLEGSGFSVI